MRLERPIAPARAPATARALAWIAGAALAAATPAAAADLSGRAELTAGEGEAIASSNDYVRQYYTLAYRHQISPPTAYQLTLRYRDERGELQFGEVQSRVRERVLEPSGSLEHRMEDFGVALAYRRNDVAAFDPDLGATAYRTIDRFSGNVYLKPFERGVLSLAADRLAFQATRVDTVDERAGLTFAYESDAFRLANEFRVQRAEDRIAQVSRVSVGPRVTAAYGRAFPGGTTVKAQYVLDYFLTEQDTRATAPVPVAVEVQGASGLFVRDDLPLDTDPMIPERRLVDRVYDVPAGVDLGPTGFSFANLGLDMGRFAAVDELRVHVRDPAGAPLIVSGLVTWTAYTSQDGVHWVPVAGATGDFDSARSAYVIAFPAITARFFKVVNFGVNIVPCWVTELEPFVHELAVPRATATSSAVRQGFLVGVTMVPADKVVLDVSGVLNADYLSPAGNAAGWYTDGTANAGARFGPYGDFQYTARQAFTMAREPGGYAQNTWATGGSIRFQPIPRYDTTLDAQIGGQRFDRPFPAESARTSNAAATLMNRLDLYDTLRIGVGGGLGRQEFAGGQTTDYWTGQGYAHADLTRELWLRLQSTLQRTISRQGELPPALAGLPVVQPVTYQLHTAEARWQRTQELALGARVGWASAEAGEGLVHEYQVSWRPFPGGSVQITIDYTQDVDPLTGRSVRRVSALPKWQINAHALVQLSYNDVRGTGDVPVHQRDVYVTFTLNM